MPTRYVSRTEQAQVNEVAVKCGYEDESLEPPAPVEELESDELLPPPSFSEQSPEDFLKHPDMVKHLDELIRARVEEQYGNWKTQVETGELSKAMDERTDKISIAVKKAMKEVDQNAVVESIEVSFPEVQKMQKK